jgi:hypothetical protein
MHQMCILMIYISSVMLSVKKKMEVRNVMAVKIPQNKAVKLDQNRWRIELCMREEIILRFEMNLFNEVTKISKSDQSRKTSRNYKSEK